MALAGVLLLTAAPVALGAFAGGYFGGRRTLRWVGLYVVASVVGWGAGRGALAAGWFWPFGLVTPLLIGATAAMLALLLARGIRVRATGASLPNTALGAVVGGGVGLALAVVAWLVLPLLVASQRPGKRQSAAPVASERTEPSVGDAIADLAQVAHRGILRHLPIVGDASRETQAMLEILRADKADHQRIFAAFDLDRLSELPEIRTALANEEVQRELEAVRGGSMLALYRLQCHPLIVAVAECEAVASRFGELRPTRIVAAIHAAQKR